MTTIPLPQRGPRPLSLRRNFAWTFAGNFVYAACQWGVLMVLAKFGTPKMVGQFVLGLAVTAPIFMFANLQLRTLQATDSQNEFQFGDYLGLRLLACLLAFGITLAVCLVGGFSRQTVLVILFVGLAKAFEATSNTFYGVLQQHERLDRITPSAIGHGVLALLSLSLGVYLTGSIVWGAAGFALSRMIVILAYDIPSGIWILRSGSPRTLFAQPGRLIRGLDVVRPRWNLRQLQRLVVLGLPLGGTSLLISLNTNIPRYFVAEIGEYELGIFGAIAALMAAGITLMRALDQASCPRLAQHYSAGKTREFRTLFVRLMLLYSALGAAGLAAAWFAGEALLTVLFRPEYAAYRDVLLYVMLAATTAYFAGAIHTALISVRCIRAQVPLLFLNTLAALIACYFLVPLNGLSGAALALAASKVPYVVVGLVLLFRVTQPQPETAESPVTVDGNFNTATEGSTRCAG